MNGECQETSFSGPMTLSVREDVNNKCQLYHIFLSVFFTQSSVSHYLEGLFFKNKNERCLSGKIRRRYANYHVKKSGI